MGSPAIVCPQEPYTLWGEWRWRWALLGPVSCSVSHLMFLSEGLCLDGGVCPGPKEQVQKLPQPSQEEMSALFRD